MCSKIKLVQAGKASALNAWANQRCSIARGTTLKAYQQVPELQSPLFRSDSGSRNCQRFTRRYVALSASRLRDSPALFAIEDATAGWAGYPGILISRASFMAPAPSRRKVALFDWITELRVRESCLGPFHRSSSFGASSAPVHCRIFCQRLPYFRLLDISCAKLFGNWIFKRMETAVTQRRYRSSCDYR